MSKLFLRTENFYYFFIKNSDRFPQNGGNRYGSVPLFTDQKVFQGIESFRKVFGHDRQERLSSLSTCSCDFFMDLIVS